MGFPEKVNNLPVIAVVAVAEVIASSGAPCAPARPTQPNNNPQTANALIINLAMKNESSFISVGIIALSAPDNKTDQEPARLADTAADFSVATRRLETKVSFSLTGSPFVRPVPRWRNWQTRRTKDPVGKTVEVQVLSWAPFILLANCNNVNDPSRVARIKNT